MASNLSLPPVDGSTLVPAAPDGRIVTYNGGGDFFSLGGYFVVTGDYAEFLLGLLPPIVHISDEAGKSELRWCLNRMRRELREPQPGAGVVMQQLASIVLVQVLRLHLAEGLKGGVGWLFALADKQMSAAITAMHADPARRWTLQAMADCAGMSRTTFTLRFKAAVGASPMGYLTRWRMFLAGDRLANTGDSISNIGLSLGYESESAFSTAFKRVMGCAPRQYARSRAAAHEPTVAVAGGVPLKSLAA